MVDPGSKGREEVITREEAKTAIVTPFKLIHAKALREVFSTGKQHYVGFELEFIQRLQWFPLNFDGVKLVRRAYI